MRPSVWLLGLAVVLSAGVVQAEPANWANDYCSEVSDMSWRAAEKAGASELELDAVWEDAAYDCHELRLWETDAAPVSDPWACPVSVVGWEAAQAIWPSLADGQCCDILDPADGKLFHARKGDDTR